MIKVYGASDDLIELEGDIREEFNPSVLDENGDKAILAFSCGTLLGITYTEEGIWRIELLVKGDATIDKVFSATVDDEDNYSDIVEVQAHNPESRTNEPIQWVALATEYRRQTK